MVPKLCRSLLFNRLLRVSTQIRQKSKRHPQWYQYRRPNEPHEIAKEFFDDLYGKRFGKDWRAIRCAMLSRKKYAAILNSFSTDRNIEETFIHNGAVDIVQQLRHNASEKLLTAKQDLKKITSEAQYNENADIDRETQNDPSHEHEISSLASTLETHESPFARLEWLERQCMIYSSLAEVCPGLHVYLHPRGVLKEFDDPIGSKTSKSVLDYFLLDGSSVLPILALDPKPHEHVLDVCAAPGGKAMCILQALRNGEGNSGSLICDFKRILVLSTLF